MATLAQIKDEVLRIVEDHIDALTGAAVVTHIQRAQRAIEDRCVWRQQHAEFTCQVSPAGTLYPVPEDFIGVRKSPRFVSRSNSNRYARVSEQDSFEDFGLLTEEGVPRYWRDVDGENISFWPIGDGAGPSVLSPGAYEIVVPYFKRLSALAADSDTNFWSETMDDVLAFRGASFLFAEMRDPMANWWSSVAAARFLEIKKQYNRNQSKRRDTVIYSTESLSSRTQNERRLGRRTWVAEIP